MSRSNTRKRNNQYIVRFDGPENAILLANADEAGLSPSSWLRQSGLKTPAPRAKRRQPADEKLLRQLLSELNKNGGNLNQGIKKFHTTGSPPPELETAFAAVNGLCDEIYAALGIAPKTAEKPPDDHQGKKPH